MPDQAKSGEDELGQAESAKVNAVQAPWLTHYYLGLRRRPSTHRTLGPRAGTAVDLNTPVLQFRDQASHARGLACGWPGVDSLRVPQPVLQAGLHHSATAFVLVPARAQQLLTKQSGGQVLQNDDAQPGMDVTVRHLKPDALPDSVFPR